MHKPPKCGNCDYYCVNINPAHADAYVSDDGRGECHRNPPKANEDGRGHWPVVADWEWCGEWAPQRRPQS